MYKGSSRRAELEAFARDSDDGQLARELVAKIHAEKALFANGAATSRLDSWIDDGGGIPDQDIQARLDEEVATLKPRTREDGSVEFKPAALGKLAAFRKEVKQKVATEVLAGGEGEKADFYRKLASKKIAGEL